MSAPNVKDLATALIVTAPSPAVSGGSLTVESGKGSRFPATPFDAIAHPDGTLPTIDNSEHVVVTGRTVDSLTITRAQGVTSNKTIESGWRISAGPFSSHIEGAYARANHTGTQSADTLTDGSTNKAYTATEQTKLAGVATGATANDTDANLKNRANHTGTQDADTITDGATNKVFTAIEKTKLSGIATGATANDTDANLKARANHTGTQAASTISDFSTAADARISAAAGVSIASLSGGKVPTSQLPAVSLTSVQTAASEVAMLALTTQEGDIVVRTDENKTYMRNAGTSGTMTDFTLLNTPPDAVTSINGQTGVVVLGKSDVGLGNVDNTSDANKPISTATQTALDAKVTGPATATDTAVATYNGTTGELVKDNPNVKIDADGSLYLESTGYQSLVLSDTASTAELLLDTTNAWGQGAGKVLIAPSAGPGPSGFIFLDGAGAPIMAMDYATGAVTINNALSGSAIVDEDAMTSDSATKVPTQQSVKAYVDTGLATKAASSHTHAQSDITNLVTDLAGKAASSHTHGVGDLTATGTPSATTYLRGDNTWATPAGGGGQELFTHIVAPSGGDYTTLGAAIAAASAGDTIYVKPGTYSESTITTALNNLRIVGENNQTSIIDISSNVVTFSGTGVKIENLYIQASTGRLVLSGANASLFDCNHVVSNVPAATAFIDSTGADCTIRNLMHSTSTPGTTRTLPVINSTGLRFRLIDSYLVASTAASATNAARALVYSNGNNAVIKGNHFYSGTGTHQTIVLRLTSYAVVTGNTFTNCGGTCVWIAAGGQQAITGNTIEGPTTTVSGYGIYLDGAGNSLINDNAIKASSAPSYIPIYLSANGSDIQVDGNQIATNTGTGISVNCTSCTVTNNRINRGAAGTSIAIAAENCLVSGNWISGFSTSSATAITDTGTNTNILGNQYNSGTGLIPINDKRVVVLRNTSGGALAAGNIVVTQSVANGYEITTSTTAGDNKVCGVLTAAIASNNNAGFVQTLGKTTLLKVDGTTDIAIGDFISNFTTAGIGAKASAGHTVIAIALEAYTANDSNGVIDALIIPPRLI